jgi:hypothetical protein
VGSGAPLSPDPPSPAQPGTTKTGLSRRGRGFESRRTRLLKHLQKALYCISLSSEFSCGRHDRSRTVPSSVRKQARQESAGRGPSRGGTSRVLGGSERCGGRGRCPLREFPKWIAAAGDAPVAPGALYRGMSARAKRLGVLRLPLRRQERTTGICLLHQRQRPRNQHRGRAVRQP